MEYDEVGFTVVHRSAPGCPTHSGVWYGDRQRSPEVRDASQSLWSPARFGCSSRGHKPAFQSNSVVLRHTAYGSRVLRWPARISEQQCCTKVVIACREEFRPAAVSKQQYWARLLQTLSSLVHAGLSSQDTVWTLDGQNDAMFDAETSFSGFSPLPGFRGSCEHVVRYVSDASTSVRK